MPNYFCPNCGDAIGSAERDIGYCVTCESRFEFDTEDMRFWPDNWQDHASDYED